MTLRSVRLHPKGRTNPRDPAFEFDGIWENANDKNDACSSRNSSKPSPSTTTGSTPPSPGLHQSPSNSTKSGFAPLVRDLLYRRTDDGDLSNVASQR